MASLEIFFIGFKHSVEPWEKFLCAMVTEKGSMAKQRGCNHLKELNPPVKDDRHTIMLGHQPNMLGSSNSAQNCSFLA